MRICVLGAGVVGLTTAWNLSRAGHQLEILDRQSGPGLETSFGNGAQLSYAFVAPFASPDILRKLPFALTNLDSAVQVKLSAKLDFIRWGLKFLAACTPKHYRETTEKLLLLAALSRGEIAHLTENLNIDFGLRTAGKLLLYRDRSVFQQACNNTSLFEKARIDFQVLTPSECLDFEPALTIGRTELAGGILTPTEQVGDCAKFCSELYSRLRDRTNVKSHFGTLVQTPIIRNGRLTAVKTSSGEVQADLFVLSMANSSAEFARACGFHLPLYPLKGYSITALAKGSRPVLSHSVTDISRKIVYAPLQVGNTIAIRVAGIVDLVGHDLTIDPRRVDSLKRAIGDTLQLDLSEGVVPWAGLRPATPSGAPITGWSPIENLFINTGHGGFGWTLACGSARIAAEMIENSRITRSDRACLSYHRQMDM